MQKGMADSKKCAVLYIVCCVVYSVQKGIPDRKKCGVWYIVSCVVCSVQKEVWSMVYSLLCGMQCAV